MTLKWYIVSSLYNILELLKVLLRYYEPYKAECYRRNQEFFCWSALAPNWSSVLGIQFNLLDSEKNQKFFVENDDIDDADDNNIDKRLQFLFWFEITNWLF